MPNLHQFRCMIYLCLGCVLLGACGTKGPLYIPEQRYPQEAPQSQAKPAQNAPQSSNAPAQ